MEIHGTFLQTDCKGERVYVRFEGCLEMLLTTIDPKLYRPHIRIEKGKMVVYADLQRARYGTFQPFQSAFRFWEQVLSNIAKLEFVVNL